MINAIVKFDTLGECENVIRESMKGLVHAGQALHYIKERKLYIQHGYNDFESYCLGRWKFSMNYSNRLISCFHVVKLLVDNNVIQEKQALHISGNSVRSLTRLKEANKEKLIPVVYKEALTQTGGQLPTGKQVTKIVDKILPAKNKRRVVKVVLEEEHYQQWSNCFNGLTEEQHLLYLIECDIALNK